MSESRKAPSRDDVYRAVGMAVLYIQSLEELILFGLSHVLPPRGDVAPEEWARQSENDQKRTLGQLIARIRARVTVSPELDRLLDDFVEARTILVHRMLRLPGFNIKNPDGMAVGFRQVQQTVETANGAFIPLAAALRAWTVDAGKPDWLAELKLLTPVGDEYRELAARHFKR